MTETHNRFSGRVQYYAKYRPGYPPGVIPLLERACGLTPAWKVADIGSGTGIFSRLLLDYGCRVYGVEPNREMRTAAAQMLAAYPRFDSVAGGAEHTQLADASVDLITAAQAFHWFDAAAAKKEFARILRPGGWVALVWNERLVDATPFLREYEVLLYRHSLDYAQVDHRNVSESSLRAFFLPEGFEKAVFPNEQRFDLEGLRGRVLSSSYTPNESHPGFPAMLADLDCLFTAHANNGYVAFAYSTTVYLGRLAATSPPRTSPPRT